MAPPGDAPAKGAAMRPTKLAMISLVLGTACAGSPRSATPPPTTEAQAEAPPQPPAPVPPPPPSPSPSPSSGQDTRKHQLDALLGERWEYTLKHSPEMASRIGDRRYNDQWADRSFEAVAAAEAADRDFLGRLQAISTDGLPVQSVLDAQIATRQLEQDLENLKLENYLMPVTQFSGVHINLPQLVPQLPFDTVKDYEDYIVRLTRIPTVFDQTIALMKRGVEKHLVPPRILLEQCVKQTLALADAAPDKSPFAGPFAKFPATIASADQDRLRAAALAAIHDQVLPAYRGFARYLREAYVAQGRKELGTWALPDGDARYAAKVREMTTTSLSPDEIHELGLREVARIEGEQAAIGKQLGFATLAAFKQHVRTNPKLYAKSREDILARFQVYVDQMYDKLPSLFGHLPKGRMVIKPVEAFREKEAAGANYSAGSPDGARPGAVMVNTYEPTKRLTIDMESTSYHEGVPGHHLQIALQQELGDLLPFRRYTHYVAFQEGWALYSESLGKEVGFYQDPYNDYGRLQDEMLRAIRLVLDTGVHHKKWTRPQMVKFFHDHSTIDEPSVQSETDRYIGNPSQALGYKIGQLTISRLRAKAQAALGPAFDIRGFHDEVLGGGALPLDVLERRIDAWIAKQKH